MNTDQKREKELETLLSSGGLGYCREAMVSITSYEHGDQGTTVHLTDESLMVYEIRLPMIKRLGACCTGELVKQMKYVTKLDDRWFELQVNNGFGADPIPPYRISLPETDPFVSKFVNGPARGRYLVTFNKKHYLMTEEAFRSAIRAVEASSCSLVDKDLLKPLDA